MPSYLTFDVSLTIVKHHPKQLLALLAGRYLPVRAEFLYSQFVLRYVVWDMSAPLSDYSEPEKRELRQLPDGTLYLVKPEPPAPKPCEACKRLRDQITSALNS